MPGKFRGVKEPAYLKAVSRLCPSSFLWRRRLKRREDAVLEDPEHHGYHLGRLNHCNWVAPVERFYILYKIEKTGAGGVVRFRTFYGPK